MSVYLSKTIKQLKSWYDKKVTEGASEFASFEDFMSWYNDQKKICHYCQLTEEESQALVMTGILKSKRFPRDGVIGRGTSRAVWLEIDRPDPKGKYSRNNAVLCCYFCNNDKSDVFSAEQYRLFVKDRPGFLRQKLNEHKNNNDVVLL